MDKELKKLSRVELLELMVSLSEDYEALADENNQLKKMLSVQRLPKSTKVGSIAEAALAANGFFDAAQHSADSYLREIKHLRDELARRVERSGQAQAQSQTQAQAQVQPQVQTQASYGQQRATAPQADMQQADIRQAQARADQIIAYANARAEAIIADANRRAEETLANANRQSHAILSQAQRQVAASMSNVSARNLQVPQVGINPGISPAVSASATTEIASRRGRHSRAAEGGM